MGLNVGGVTGASGGGGRPVWFVNLSELISALGRERTSGSKLWDDVYDVDVYRYYIGERLNLELENLNP